jgi:hypothetical protein
MLLRCRTGSNGDRPHMGECAFLARGWRLLLCLLVLGPLSGCATVQIVPAERLNEQRLTTEAAPVAHIYVANWGLYLFKYLPIATGSLSRPGAVRWPALFSDQVQIELLVAKVSQESKQRGGTVITDLRTRDRSYWMPYTQIFWLNELEVSANASRSPGATDKR